MQSPAQTRVIHFDSDCLMAVHDRLAIAIWAGGVTDERARLTERVGRLALSLTGRAGLVGVVEASASPPGVDTRAVTTAINAKLVADGAVGVAGIVAGQGFRASATRAVITGLSLLSPEPYPFKVFCDASRAVHWISQALAAVGDEELDHRASVEVIETLRGRLRLQHSWVGSASG